MAGPQRLDAAAFGRWIAAARSALEQARPRLDALNVFPVPDSDTGSNLAHTLQTATAAVRSLELPGLTARAGALAHEALRGARGNSGVILGQFLAGFAEAMAARPETDEAGLDGAGLAACLDRGRTSARSGVARPLEGTILTVADAAADAALAAADAGRGAPEVAEAAVEAAAAALDATADQLPTLRSAGVVDAGGAGLLVFLDALHVALGGRPREALAGPLPAPAPAEEPAAGVGSYEVMYELPAGELDALRETLAAVGDSLVVAGDAQTAIVHVHTAEPGAAIEAAYAYGLPRGIRVSWLGPAEVPDEAASASALLALAPGPAVAATLRAAGAHVLTEPVTAPGLLAAARRTGAARVVVLPAGPDGLAVARAAARLAEGAAREIVVVPSFSVPGVLAALAVADAADPAHLAATAAACRSGALVADGAGVAARLDAAVGPLSLVAGAAPEAAVALLLHELVGVGAELVTLVVGPDSAALADTFVADLAARRPEVEVVRLAGDEPGTVLVGVE